MMDVVTIDYRVYRRWLRWRATVTTTRAKPGQYEFGGRVSRTFGPAWRKRDVTGRAERFAADLADRCSAMGHQVSSACVWVRIGEPK